MGKIWTILSHYKEILALANDVKLALADKQVTSDEAKAISQKLIDLLVTLKLLK